METEYSGVALRVVVIDDATGTMIEPVAVASSRRRLPAQPAVPERVPEFPRLSADQCATLARCAAVFQPADPARVGRVAFYGAALPASLLPEHRETITVATRHGTGARRRSVPAVRLPIVSAVPALARAVACHDADPAAAFWGATALFALHLVGRGRLLPGVSAGQFDAWRAGPLDREDVERLRALAEAMPPTARAIPVPGDGPLTLPEAEPLVRAFLDAVADTMPRTAAAALASGSPVFTATAPQHAGALRDWAAEVATGMDAGVRVSLRVEFDETAFRAVTQLHSLADPTLVADAARVWRPPTDQRFGARAQIDTLLTLRRAARVWPPLQRMLSATVPDAMELSDDEVYDLLGSESQRLAAAGVGVHLPKELARSLTAQAVLAERKRPGSALPSFFSAQNLVAFRWQIALGGEPLTEPEMDRLAEATRPLVRLRDQWVLVDAELIRKARSRELRPLSPIDALGAALTGVADVDGELIPVAASGWTARLRDRLTSPQSADGEPISAPQALHATLRGYQLEGLRWLDRMTSIGLGCCLADDMGLGKTVTLIALHLHRQHAADPAAPTLVVCPASLLGNWQREIERFAPGTPVRRYHGPGRHLDGIASDEFVLTTYGTMRQDAADLARTGWGLLAADEAQHAKNPHSDTAKALRAIPAQARVALTGTPVENNLSELWALLDWTTPGLLGTLRVFRDRYARAIEGAQDRDAADRLARLIGPFVLRRRKSDPGIAPELPAKTETDHPIELTREQTVLYEALVRETMTAIEGTEGIARRGLILKLLTALKQICNHPAQYLKQEGGPTAGRSGKLELLDELLETILAENGSTLIFSQYVEMGRLLERHLAGRGVDTLFLHGQTPVRRRQEMVDAFQSGRAPVFLLSLKAAGVGLNLTRAGHVVHYDRWWNPAVEEQATDRAYRIGQSQPVQVHRLIAEGTVEERIAETLAVKKDLADSVLASGEAAFTELTNEQLADLFTLRKAGH